jgi:hypothetical protein
MISTNLQAKYDLEDFEHSKASKRRKRVEFASLVFLTIALISQVAWVLS